MLSAVQPDRNPTNITTRKETGRGFTPFSGALIRACAGGS